LCYNDDIMLTFELDGVEYEHLYQLILERLKYITDINISQDKTNSQPIIKQRISLIENTLIDGIRYTIIKVNSQEFLTNDKGFIIKL